jgi:hypothetical protein
MSYFEIIFLGYLINYLFVIIYTILIFMYKLDVNYIVKIKNLLDEHQKDLIKKSVNPFRTKDFIKLLPFGYALQICSKICVSKNKFIYNIYDEMSEKEEYLNKLEKEYNEKTI